MSIETKFSEDELKRIATLTEHGKNIAFVQGYGKDQLYSFNTHRKRYFKLDFLEIKCETGRNYQGNADLVIKSRDNVVLDVGWIGQTIRINKLQIHTYQANPEWENLILEMGKEK